MRLFIPIAQFIVDKSTSPSEIIVTHLLPALLHLLHEAPDALQHHRVGRPAVGGGGEGRAHRGRSALHHDLLALVADGDAPRPQGLEQPLLVLLGGNSIFNIFGSVALI